MNGLLDLLNTIKTHNSERWLTPTQAAAVRAVLDRLVVPGVINLVGPAGAGKTFCTWQLARRLDALYCGDPQALVRPATLGGALLVDNAPADEPGFRRLLTELQMREVGRAVVCTRRPNTLRLPVVALSAPTTDDCAHITAHLETHCPFYPGPPQANLWAWLRSACD